MQNLTEQTYLSIRSDLKTFIHGRVRNKDLAEDILHDVFIKVHSNINKLKDPSKLTSWIYQITRNSINDFYRTKKTEPTDKTDIIDKSNIEKPASVKLERSIRTFIKNMPRIYREAIILTDYKGLTQTELADKLILSVPAAKSRVLRARKMLKDMLLECCHFE